MKMYRYKFVLCKRLWNNRIFKIPFSCCVAAIIFNHFIISCLIYISLFLLVHYYDYYKDGWSAHFYPWTRFSSEYGFQSLPSYRSLQTVSIPSDLERIGTMFMQHRQHLALGYVYIWLQMFYHFSIPSTFNVQYFAYLSQVTCKNTYC